MRRAALGTALAAFVMTVASGADHPNVVMTMTDDLGADVIGCYGGETAPTPHIDAVAA